MKPERDIEKLKQYDGEDKITGSLNLDLILKTEGDELKPYVHSMIPSLDHATNGFYLGELITVSGYTKQGKTLLCQSLTKNFISQQRFPLWFSFEVPTRQFFSQFPDLPNFYLPMKLRAHSMDWVEERILESFAKFNTRIIFIDHLHFLFDMARSKNVSLEIGQLIRRLKEISNEYGFIVFVLCHTTKSKPGEEAPDYSAIRDSSLISQESDSVFMVARTPKVGENAAQMRVEFHRRTGVLERVIKLVKVNGLLKEDIDKKYQDWHDQF
ncbi:MAG: DnaB-like helicase C-terminal domain-containing protein [Nitrospiria bacterium]